MMRERILIIDGATGTYLQKKGLTEDDFRGTLFTQHGTQLTGCNDVLCLTQPEIIAQMHRDYAAAGADIIETNSFNCNCFSLADYGLQHLVYDIAKAAAALARKVADEITDRPVFVAGSVGPTNRTASMSSDVNDPANRDVTFTQLVDTYTDSIHGLLDGGADIILIETIFDTLNAKAALKAVSNIETERGIDIPLMVSGTFADTSGRTLSGQTVDAFAASMSHANLLSIGFNCAFGAQKLRPWVERLSNVTSLPVSAHPNAGLPNVMGEYDETPHTFCAAAEEYIRDGIINIYGGCCGTTPEHIRHIVEMSRKYPPRPLPHPTKTCTLSGLEPLKLCPETGFVNVGERTNVAGSAKFKRLIEAGEYEEALSVARNQVENGAQVIDICMDDGMINGVKAMTVFLNLIASEPDIAKVPVMIDSSDWDIIRAGLDCVQGKSIVNSISLKEGEAPFLEKARYIHTMGAAAVVMLFDEKGQADTYERKVEVARRAYRLLKDAGFPTEDIIFDPNVLAVATGMPEHDDYARAFIEACRTIHQEMPEVHLSGGISNLSFSFRGNNAIREAMHSVFLYHAIKAGLDMSIVNPGMLTLYDDIPADMLKVVEDVILNTDSGAAERLIAFAEKVKDGVAEGVSHTANAHTDEWRKTPVKQRIMYALLKGLSEYIEADAMEAYNEAGSALNVIDNYLMPGMDEVGRLFGDGKMFLPQVVKSARVMKRAVGVLEPFMGKGAAERGRVTATNDNGGGACGACKVLLATVKGDVHDIGKNIVDVVLQCNGFEVKNLGVMVENEAVVEEARNWGADIIGLSGLITPSLGEMINVVKLLEKHGMTTPVIIGGATTSELHTAVKIAPAYPSGVVVRANAAADNPAIIRRLMGNDKTQYINEIKAQQQKLRDEYNAKK